MEATVRPLQLACCLDHEFYAVGAFVIDATTAHGFGEVPDHGPGHARQVAQVARLSSGRGHLRRRHDASLGEGRPPPGLSSAAPSPLGGLAWLGKESGCGGGGRESSAPGAGGSASLHCRRSSASQRGLHRPGGRRVPHAPRPHLLLRLSRPEESAGSLLPGVADQGCELRGWGEGARVSGAGRQWPLGPLPGVIEAWKREGGPPTI